MLRQTFILAIVLCYSFGCNDKIDESYHTETIQKPITKNENKVGNALIFINAYVENSNKMNKSISIIDWVNSNNLTSKGFKVELKRIIEEAYKQDSELGLGFDPIFDAQDNPSKGFEFDSFDENSNYLIVKGKDWPEFKLTIKIIEENKNWLVDGCGIVNIPNDKRARR